MIVSHKYKYVCLNPPKTGTGFREKYLYNYCDISWITSLIDAKPPLRHSIYSDACKFFQQYGWNIHDYYIFTFVRNPWWRYASWYNMLLNRNQNIEPFANYIKVWSNQDNYFLKDNKQVVDFVGDCDSQNESLEKILIKLGIKQPDNFIDSITIPRHRERHVRRNYKDFYTRELIEMVAEKEKAVIERFGYTFD